MDRLCKFIIHGRKKNLSVQHPSTTGTHTKKQEEEKKKSGKYNSILHTEYSVNIILFVNITKDLSTDRSRGDKSKWMLSIL
jgi:hypothetical protein